MASLPDDVYKRIISKLHPSPSDLWQPVAEASVGQIQIFNLAEACYEVDPDFPFLPEDHDKIPLRNGRLSLMRFGLCLVRLPNKINVLLDAGVGPWLSDVEKCSGHPVPEQPPHGFDTILQTLGLSLEDVHLVVHSHCHGDHVGWVGRFPNATHVLHAKEYEYARYSGCPWNRDATARFVPIEKEGRLRLVEGEHLIPIDEEKCPQLTAFLCPGHTPGHIAIRISDDTIKPPQSAFYIGDSMHFPCQISNPDLVPLFDCCAWKSRPFLPTSNVQESWLPELRTNPKWNCRTGSEARRSLLTLIAEENALLLSPHFPPPGMGTVQKNGEGFAYCQAAA